MVKVEKIVTYTCDLCQRVKRPDEISRVHLDMTPHATPDEGFPRVLQSQADVCDDCQVSLTVTRLLGLTVVTGTATAKTASA